MVGFYVVVPISMPLGEHPRVAPTMFPAAPPVFNAATALVAPLLVAPQTQFCATPPTFTTAQYATLGEIFSGWSSISRRCGR
jgi:hypothetical protein